MICQSWTPGVESFSYIKEQMKIKKKKKKNEARKLWFGTY